MTRVAYDRSGESIILKEASNEILLAELKVRRESAIQLRDEYYKAHWVWGRLYICITALAGVCVLIILAAACDVPIVREPIVLLSTGITLFSLVVMFIFVLFKDERLAARFEKEYPDEAELLFGM
jgi:L-asparagine transporter-like permease